VKSGPSVVDHKFLNKFGKDKLSVEQEIQKVNQEFLSDPKFSCDEKSLAEFRNKFVEMDEDGSGDIDIRELGKALERLGKPKNHNELKKIIAEVDMDKDGAINYREFLHMMLGKQSSVLRLILMFEGMAKKDEKPKGPAPKKPLSDLIKK